MGETQVLLQRIAALRQRLERARGLAQDGGPDGVPAAVDALEQAVAAGRQYDAWLDATLRKVGGPPGETTLPAKLTARARQLVERGHGLLGRLRALADDLDPHDPDAPADPLVGCYRDTVAMTNAGLRLMQALPDAPGAQLRLCDGVDVILGTVAERIDLLTAAVGRRRADAAAVDGLAALLSDLAAGRPVDARAVTPLAETELARAEDGEPLHFLHPCPADVARFIAGHCLNVARVVARAARPDAALHRRPAEPVVAALVHDVGMLLVPPDVLRQPGPLTDEQRRVVEWHARAGAEAAARLLPGETWLAEAVAAHHERLNGTGYPAGRRDETSALARLLAACDVYAALCSPRPHRPARDARAALTETLLLAERGLLDAGQAGRLLALSFYPPGSVVELADGAVAAVVATHPARADGHTPARPVVAVLTDTSGHPLPAPHFLDLARCEGRGIVRALEPAERHAALGKRYPAWA